MFDPKTYGPEVARILELRDAGKTDEARDVLRGSELPDTVRAGLYLACGGWNEAHNLVQDIEAQDAYFWHAIVHRQEPDAANSSYWFRRVGSHPIFPALAVQAEELGYRTGGRWDPFTFIQYCEDAHTGSEEECIAKAVEQAEWELLFDHCAR